MQATRIAMATADGLTVSGHLARSIAFVVLELAEGRIVSTIVRDRGNGQCGSHKTFLELAEGCGALICAGISQNAYDLLQGHGIQPVVLASSLPFEDAARGYLSGTLATSTERSCLCH